MKTKINEQKLNMLNVIKNKVLLREGQILILTNFTVEEINEINYKFFGKTEAIKVKYITSMRLQAYHAEGKFLGFASDTVCNRYLNYVDFYKLRQNWIDLNDQLKSFGFQVMKIDDNEKTLLERAFEAGREYQGYKNNLNLEEKEKSWNLTFTKWCEKNNIK